MKKGINSVKNLIIAKTAFTIVAGGVTLASAFNTGKIIIDEPVKSSVYVSSDFTAFNASSIDEYLVYDDDTNKKNLKEIKKLNIDVIKTDFNDLDLMPNVEELIITNFGYLTKEAKESISKLFNLKKITIIFGKDLANKENMDLSWIRKDISINIEMPTNKLHSPFDDIDTTDMYDVFKYNVISTIIEKNDGRVKCDFFDNEDYISKYNDKLNQMSSIMGITDDMDDEEKIVRIVKYVTDYIEYDPKISEILELDISSSEQRQLLLDTNVLIYNTYLVGTVLHGENRYGVCCNYAALTALLGYYNDVSISYANSFNHAWCQYNKDGESYIIDPTFLDGNSEYNELKKCNIDTKDTYVLNLMKDKVIVPYKDSYKILNEFYFTESAPEFKIRYINANIRDYRWEEIISATITVLLSLLVVDGRVIFDVFEERAKKKMKQLENNEDMV